MRLFGVSIGAYRLAMPRSVPPLLTPLLRGHLAAAADRFLNERGQMVEDVIGTRDPKSVAKFLVAEGYLENVVQRSTSLTCRRTMRGGVTWSRLQS
jgi:hypothetical protein